MPNTAEITLKYHFKVNIKLIMLIMISNLIITNKYTNYSSNLTLNDELPSIFYDHVVYQDVNKQLSLRGIKACATEQSLAHSVI